MLLKIEFQDAVPKIVTEQCYKVNFQLACREFQDLIKIKIVLTIAPSTRIRPAMFHVLTQLTPRLQ